MPCTLRLEGWQVNNGALVASAQRFIVEVVHIRMMERGNLRTIAVLFLESRLVCFDDSLVDNGVKLKSIDTGPADFVQVVSNLAFVFRFALVVRVDGRVP